MQSRLQIKLVTGSVFGVHERVLCTTVEFEENPQPRAGSDGEIER